MALSPRLLYVIIAMYVVYFEMLFRPPRRPSCSRVTLLQVPRTKAAVTEHFMHRMQFFANLYGIPVPAGSSDPDVFITLEVLNGDTNVGLYCNPGWGQYADVNANYPQPGYAVWQSGGRTL